MKIVQLRQLIREEVRKVVREEVDTTKPYVIVFDRETEKVSFTNDPSMIKKYQGRAERYSLEVDPSDVQFPETQGNKEWNDAIQSASGQRIRNISPRQYFAVYVEPGKASRKLSVGSTAYTDISIPGAGFEKTPVEIVKIYPTGQQALQASKSEYPQLASQIEKMNKENTGGLVGSREFYIVKDQQGKIFPLQHFRIKAT